MHATRGPYQIELVGLPGAGKSTWVARELAARVGPLDRTRQDLERLVASCHARRGQLRRWGGVARWVAGQPTLVARLLQYEASFGPSGRCDGSRHVYRLLRRLHNDALVRETAEWGRWPRLILDQGFVQQLWAISFLRSAHVAAPLAHVLEHARDSLPDELTWVRVPAEVAMARMRTRRLERGYADGDFEERLDTLSAADLERGVHELSRILAELERLGVPVKFVDGTQPRERLHTVGQLLPAPAPAGGDGSPNALDPQAREDGVLDADQRSRK